METGLLLFLLTLLIILLFIIIAGLGLLIFKAYKRGLLAKMFEPQKEQSAIQSENSNATQPTEAVVQKIESNHKGFHEDVQGMCLNHKDTMAAGMCAICTELFCETCLREHETLAFCTEHYALFLNHKWVEVETVITTPQDPESALHLHRHKERHWLHFKRPSFIMTHYKIDIDTDHIHSYVKLYSRVEDQETMRPTLDLGKKVKDIEH